jgi:hypothetical protein
MEEHDVALAPGEASDVTWDIIAPDRTGRWIVRTRSRAERTEGADPDAVFMDVRPPNQVQVVGAVASRPWAAPEEDVEVSLQLTDSGSRPGHEATVTILLEGEEGESSSSSWKGWLGPEEESAAVILKVPARPDSSVAEGEAKGSGRFALVVRDARGKELLRVPGAVAVRRRVNILPRVIKAKPDPLRIGDCLLPGERVVRTVDEGETTLIELSSGCRVYVRGDRVAGVDDDVPMDDEFWDKALDADLGLYTDVKKGLQLGAKAAQAEALVMGDLAEGLHKEGVQASHLVRSTRELASSFDPDKMARRKGPRKGPMAPLVAWLSDPRAPAQEGRSIVPDLRRFLSSYKPEAEGDARGLASAAARAASDHLDRMAELLNRAWEGDRMDAKVLRASAALVAAAGVAQVELHGLRETADPWTTTERAEKMKKAALLATMTQLASLIELIARHRVRREAATANTRQRAAHAAVTRELEVRAAPSVGHSGDAAEVEVELENRSSIDLLLRLNVALPSAAWTVLEPQASGAQGLKFVGPVEVPARSTERIRLLVYVPTTVRLDDYPMPVEVVPEPRDVIPEQGGGGR